MTGKKISISILVLIGFFIINKSRSYLTYRKGFEECFDNKIEIPLFPDARYQRINLIDYSYPCIFNAVIKMDTNVYQSLLKNNLLIKYDENNPGQEQKFLKFTLKSDSIFLYGLNRTKSLKQINKLDFSSLYFKGCDCIAFNRKKEGNFPGYLFVNFKDGKLHCFVLCRKY